MEDALRGAMRSLGPGMIFKMIGIKAFGLALIGIPACASSTQAVPTAGPDSDPSHFAVVLEAADSAWLEVFSLHRGPVADRLRVDPRPLEWHRRFPGPDGVGLERNDVSPLRSDKLASLGIPMAGDADLRCAPPRFDMQDTEESWRRIERCVEEGVLWVYVSRSRPHRGDGDDAVWTTRVSATAGGLRYVIVDVLTRRIEGRWQATDVLMVENVMD